MKVSKKNKRRLLKQRLHTSSRAQYRYGIEMSEEDYNEIVTTIRNDPFGTYVLILSNTRAFCLVLHKGILLPIIYDRKRNTVATVLPTPYYIYGEML